MELPADRLEELASLVGNSAMEELLESQSPSLEETVFSLPPEEPGTEGFPVQPGTPVLTDPGGMTGEPVVTAAFDPAGIATGL